MLWCFTFVTQGPGFSLQALSRRRAAAFLEGKSVCCDFSELTGVKTMKVFVILQAPFHDMEHQWDLFHLWRFGLQLRTGVSTGSQFTSLDWAMFRCWARWLHIRPAACGILWLCQLKLCQLGDGHREEQEILQATLFLPTNNYYYIFQTYPLPWPCKRGWSEEFIGPMQVYTKSWGQVTCHRFIVCHGPRSSFVLEVGRIQYDSVIPWLILRKSLSVEMTFWRSQCFFQAPFSVAYGINRIATRSDIETVWYVCFWCSKLMRSNHVSPCSCVHASGV